MFIASITVVGVWETSSPGTRAVLTESENGSIRQDGDSGSWVPLVVGAILAVAGGIVVALIVASASGRGTGNVQLSNLLFFGIPVVIYLALRRRRQDEWSRIYSKLGLKLGHGAYYLWAVVLAGLLLALYYGAAEFLLPSQARQAMFEPYSGLEVSLLTFGIVFASEALTVALGEELFFRGLLGGWAMRRFGYWKGNALQAALFVVPHLPILYFNPAVWPLVFVFPLLVGWMNGWLMYRSGSIWPGWILHSLVNAVTKIWL